MNAEGHRLNTPPERTTTPTTPAPLTTPREDPTMTPDDTELLRRKRREVASDNAYARAWGKALHHGVPREEARRRGREAAAAARAQIDAQENAA